MSDPTSYFITGGNGGTYIDTTANTPAPDANKFFAAIAALTETVLDYSAMDAAGYRTTDAIAGFDSDITIPAGMTIYGRFDGITLVSGTCIAYHDG